MAMHFFNKYSIPRNNFYFQTAPLTNVAEYVKEFHQLGMMIAHGTPDDETWLRIHGRSWAWFMTPQEQSTIVAYYTPALQKIDKILGGYELGFPDKRIHAKDLPTYTRLTSKAASFLKSTTNYDPSPIKNIVNDWRDRELRVEQPGYRRMLNIPTELKMPQIERRATYRLF